MTEGSARPIAEVMRDAERLLTAAGVPSPRADAELLLAHVLGVEPRVIRLRSIAGSPATADPADLRAFAAAVARRADREPLQHITGVAPFRFLALAVGPGAFVPRPETELTAELALRALRDAGPGAVAVDLGTGSGAIALALASEAPDSSVIGVEVSPPALVWARRNAAALALPNLRIVEGDLADVLPELDGKVSVVVSNPPYVPDDAVPRDPEVRLYDPAIALYGGPDGLDLVRAVIATAARLLRPAGTVVIEHGELQGAAIRAQLPAQQWSDAATARDLTDRDRITSARRR